MTPLLVGDNVCLSHEEAMHLRADDVRPGECVMIDGRSHVANVMRTLSVWHSGGVATWCHPRWPAVMTVAAAAAAGVGQLRDDDVAALVFTSGSSGVPKAVALSERNLQAAADASNHRIPFGDGDRWLLSLPLCHVGGLSIVMRAVRGGGTVVVPREDMLLGDALRHHQPSHVSLVATQLMRLLHGLDEDVAALRGCREVVVGGGPVSSSLVELAQQHGVFVRQTWGMTETTAQVCTSDRGAAHSCGHALNGMQVRVDIDGQLQVKGDALFQGYVDARSLSLRPQRPVDEEGWFGTGDVGQITPSGVVITGRADRRFISGGENVHPEAVASLLSDGHVQLWVVAIADDTWGARPFAFYDSYNGDDNAVQQRLQQRAVELLPSFMRPAGYARLPLSLGLKPSLSALTECANSISNRKEHA
jgi:o-succinylbenzoate---CoA ligase